MVDLKSQPKLVHHLRLNTDFLLFSKKEIIEKMCKKWSKLTKKLQIVNQNPDEKKKIITEKTGGGSALGGFLL